MVQHLTTQQAAAEILALVNASPRTPRPEEIEAIIARADSPSLPLTREATAFIDLFNSWAAMKEPNDDPDSPEHRAHQAGFDRMHHVVHAAAARIVRTSADPVALAAVALSFWQDTEIDFANPAPTASEPEAGGWGGWASHALAATILRRAVANRCVTGGALGEVSPAVAVAFTEWETARRLDHETNEWSSIDEDSRIHGECCARSDAHAEKSEALLALGAKSFADLRLLLPCVMEWNTPLHISSPDFPHCILEKGGQDEGEGLEPKSVAYFVLAVMGLIGMADVGRQPVAVREGRGEWVKL